MYVNSSKFMYDKVKKRFIAEASEINFRLSRIYQDSADVGMFIVSNKTGQELRFYLTQTEKREGDIIAWHFKADSRKPELKNITAVVFND